MKRCPGSRRPTLTLRDDLILGLDCREHRAHFGQLLLQIVHLGDFSF